MLFCNECGQSPFIDNSDFNAYIDTRASQRVYIDSTHGNINDYGDIGDHDDNGDPYEFECPYCDCMDINTNWDGDEQEALRKRLEYLNNIDEASEVENEIFQERLKLILKHDLDWDN